MDILSWLAVLLDLARLPVSALSNACEPDALLEGMSLSDVGASSPLLSFLLDSIFEACDEDGLALGLLFAGGRDVALEDDLESGPIDSASDVNSL